MASSSPLRRRSYQFSSPQRSILSDYLSEPRNTEERHKQLLENAAKEHERVLADAERVFHECQRLEEERLISEQRRLIAEETKRHEETLRLQAQVAKEREELQRLKVKSASPATSPAPGAHKASSQPATPQSALRSTAPPNGIARGPTPAANGTNGGWTEPSIRSSPLAQTNALRQSPAAPSARTSSIFTNSPSQHLRPPSTTTTTGSAVPFPKAAERGQLKPPQPATTTPSPATARPESGPDRYQIIHKNLKELRKVMAEQTKTNPALKSRMGDMRRDIRKSVGQLTGEKGANTKQTQKVTALLRESLSGSIPCSLIDPNNFVVQPRSPVDGAARNQPQLPSLFLYLLNIFSKAAMSQWKNEGSAKPETAGPVGVVVVGIFAEPEFLWRGQSMIDMMVAKFRVVCPVLFGFRGSEATDAGRRLLGWKKEGGLWTTDQQHYDSMAGLGAGFAAIALRSFGKSKKVNPYPPRHYWIAMARIVDTPGVEISNSQCVVLKAMIALVETKFITFYGNAAIQALKAALIDFPAKASEKSAAVTALSVHAEVLQRDLGLVLTL